VTSIPQPGAIEALEHRRRVLARRKLALVVLVGLAVALLGAAIVTGSYPLLIAGVVVDVALAGYIAMLLQIKQQRTESQH